MIIWHTPCGRIIIKSLSNVSAAVIRTVWKRTVLSCEQRSDNTSCLSGHVVMYVMALTPLIGKISRLCKILKRLREFCKTYEQACIMTCLTGSVAASRPLSDCSQVGCSLA